MVFVSDSALHPDLSRPYEPGYFYSLPYLFLLNAVSVKVKFPPVTS